MIMKRLAIFTAVLILGASLASAQARHSSQFSNPLLNEVVRMSNAGIGNETIIAYVKARQARLEGVLTADDLIALRESGVGEPVINFLASVTGFGVSAGSLDAGQSVRLAAVIINPRLFSPVAPNQRIQFGSRPRAFPLGTARSTGAKRLCIT